MVWIGVLIKHGKYINLKKRVSKGLGLAAAGNREDKKEDNKRSYKTFRVEISKILPFSAVGERLRWGWSSQGL